MFNAALFPFPDAPSLTFAYSIHRAYGNNSHPQCNQCVPPIPRFKHILKCVAQTSKQSVREDRNQAPSLCAGQPIQLCRVRLHHLLAGPNAHCNIKPQSPSKAWLLELERSFGCQSVLQSNPQCSKGAIYAPKQKRNGQAQTDEWTSALRRGHDSR